MDDNSARDDPQEQAVSGDQASREHRQYVSNSQVGLFKHCKRRWYLAHYRELDVRPDMQKPAGALQLGTRIHEVLYRRYQFGEDALYALKDVYERDEKKLIDLGALETDVVLIRKEHDLAHAMISGYEQWLSETAADQGLTVVGAEVALEAPAPGLGRESGQDHDWYLRGKLDQRVVREHDGARLFLDHKTVADFAGAGRTLLMNPQMKFYHLLERLDAISKTGSEPPSRTDGGLYNMLRKVKRTASAKPPFYQRIEVRHNDEELRVFWQQVFYTILEIIDVRRKLDLGMEPRAIAYPNPTPDCTWKCQFFSVCGLMDDGSDWEGMLREFFVHADPDARYKEVITKENDER